MLMPLKTCPGHAKTGMDMAVRAPPVPGHRSTAPPRARACLPRPPPRSPPPSTHASPAEQPDGGRVDAPGASRRTDHALCRRDPLVSTSSAARTGPSPGLTAVHLLCHRSLNAPPPPPPHEADTSPRH